MNTTRYSTLLAALFALMCSTTLPGCGELVDQDDQDVSDDMDKGGDTTPDTGNMDGAVTLRTSFAEGTQGWRADISDFIDGMQSTIEFDGGMQGQPMGTPAEAFDTSTQSMRLYGKNAADDIFMYLTRQVETSEGLDPDTQYRMSWTVRFASREAFGCAGIGGAPGESVFVKVGGATTEPRTIPTDTEPGYQGLSVDKGAQSQGGPAGTVLGNIANDIECGAVNPTPFRWVEHAGNHETPVTTDADGQLWLLMGFDSGYEGITELYVDLIEVTLTPVE